MPSKVRIISKKDESWDSFVRDLVESEGFGKERTYFGIEEIGRADEVVRKLRTAGRNHLRVGMKVYSRQCKGCPEGGDSCRYHVLFTAYDISEAQAFMERKKAAAGG